MIRKSRLAILLVSALALGVGNANAGGVLRVTQPDEPAGLDATTTNAAAIAGALLYNTMETLIQVNDEGGLEPLLAESWDVSEDGLTYVFNIREGVKWHDGSDLTLDDVIWTFEHGRTEGNVQSFAFADIDTIEATGPNQMTVTLKSPNSSFLSNMAKRSGFILAERFIEAQNGSPMGTGPFKFVEWNRGENMIFERFDDYWGTPAKLDGIEWTYIPDANAEINALLAGDIDAVQALNAKSRVGELTEPDFVVESGAITSVHILSINHDVAPFDNPRIRQALYHAIDGQAIVDGMNNGFGTATRTFASPLDPYFDPTYDPYPYDPAKARAILKEEGMEGLEVEIQAIIDNPGIRQAEIVLGQLFAAGFRPTIKSFDLGTGLASMIRNRTYEIATIGLISERILRMTCEANWFQNYCDEEFDAHMARALSASDPADIKAAYLDAIHYLADDAAIVPFYTDVRVGVHRDYVTGWRPIHPDSVLDLRNVDIVK